jgi:hypothetical protein
MITEVPIDDPKKAKKADPVFPGVPRLGWFLKIISTPINSSA